MIKMIKKIKNDKKDKIKYVSNKLLLIIFYSKNMINKYVLKLIENLPNEIKNCKEPIKLDLVLDGGIFNGSYLVGALHFLKEMEKKKFIKIDRISSCSVGSIIALLYYIDCLDLMPKLYELIYKDFKISYNLKLIKDLKKLLGKNIPNNICEKVNNKFFISFNNLKKGIKVIKCKYKNDDELFNSIIKSCFIPFLIDGNILFENKFMDGITPFIFKNNCGNKILYLDLFGYDKIGNLLNIKNEKSNFHRILSGLLDIHTFFIKENNTLMCSYVNNWNIGNLIINYLKKIIEKCLIYVTYFLIFLKDKIPPSIKETVISKISLKIMKDIFIILLENYCL
jgi:hypothetical protein